MKTIRIAFVASTLGVGGAERVVFDVATRLPHDRYLSAFYLLKGRGTIGGELHEKGYAVTDQLQHGRFDPGTVVRIARRLRSFSPDILFLLDHHNAILWGGLAGMLSGVRHRVVACHATGRMGGRPSFNAADRAVMRTASVVVALSESHTAYLRDREGIPAAKLRMIENGVDYDRYVVADREQTLRVRRQLGIGERDRVVTMVAVLRPEKAHEALLQAAVELGTSEPWKFLIVGAGAARAVLESRAARLGLEDRVLFLGERDDVPVLLALSDVLVLPSHDAVETLPLAILEAMAAGVPVVASAVGSVPDVIEDGVNGRLIAPADAHGLAGAVRDIMDDRAKSAQMAHNAGETVRTRYGIGRMVAGYQALFESLVTGDPREDSTS